MQVLFQLDYQGDDVLPTVHGFLREQCDEPDIVDHARRLMEGVRSRRDALDARIDAAAQHWSLERMSGVDRNIMRVALFEMLECNDPPPKVALNEAIEIAKQFGTKESPQFVNGMLDAVWKTARSADADAETGPEAAPAEPETQGD